jgi:hypothetical protein
MRLYVRLVVCAWSCARGRVRVVVCAWSCARGCVCVCVKDAIITDILSRGAFLLHFFSHLSHPRYTSPLSPLAPPPPPFSYSDWQERLEAREKAILEEKEAAGATAARTLYITQSMV